MTQPLEERFWSKVDMGDDDVCWNWTGNGQKGLHGRFWLDGKYVGPHRFSWELHYGDIPDGMYVCHSCDSPPCCNPRHLFLGTAQDNMNDMINKNRDNKAKGDDHCRSKLTSADVLEIREHYDYGVFNQKEIAAHYSVDPSAISDVVWYKSWRHI